MDAATAARLDALESREEIRDVLHRYARGVDRCDADLMRSVYHPDATDVHAGTFVGNAHEFVDFVLPMMATALVNRHVISNPMIELDGDRAFVESQYVSTHRVAIDGERAGDIYAEGRYLDVFERRSGRWRILHRLVIPEKAWTREAVVAGTAPDVGGVRATVGPDDPVYLGFGVRKISPGPRNGTDPMAGLRALFTS